MYDDFLAKRYGNQSTSTAKTDDFLAQKYGVSPVVNKPLSQPVTTQTKPAVVLPKLNTSNTIKPIEANSQNKPVQLPSLKITEEQANKVKEENKNKSSMSALQGLGYGTERAAAGLLGVGEGIVDFVGSTINSGISDAFLMSSALAGGNIGNGNAVSDWLLKASDNFDKSAKRFYEKDVAGDYEQSIKERYKPTELQDKVTGYAQGVTNILPTIGANVALPGAGLATMATSAAGNSANAAFDKSGDIDNSNIYGALSGAVEVVTEKLFGGIPQLNEGVISKAVKNVINKNPTVANIMSKVIDVGGEGVEEALSTIIDPVLQRMTIDPNADSATVQQVLESALSGVITSAVLQGGFSVGDKISNKSQNTTQSTPQNAATNTIQNTPQANATDIKTQVSNEVVTPQQQTLETKPQNELNKKAQTYKNKSEQYFLNDISKSLSIPKTAQTQNLKSVVTEIANEIKTNGKISEQRSNELFEKAYNEGVMVVDDYYNQYKPLKDNLRNTKLSLSDNAKSSISDYNAFRKSNLGVLSITNDGMPIDTKYKELTETYPELFSSEITNEADQIQRVSEVAKSIKKVEKDLNDYYGEDAQSYKEFARYEFDKALDKLSEEMQVVNRYSTEEKVSDASIVSVKDVKRIHEDIKKLKKQEAKVAARHLLTKSDNVQIDRLLKGEITEDQIADGTNKKAIIDVYRAKKPSYELQKNIDNFNTIRKADLRNKSLELIDNSPMWKDKKIGLQYSRETMERNIMDIVPNKAEAKAIVDYYFTPVHENEAKSIKMKNNYRDRIRKLNLNKYESVYTQLYGEYEYHRQNSKSEKSQEHAKFLEEKALEFRTKHDKSIDDNKIKGAVEEFRNIYNELIGKVNNVMIDNGYRPIEYRQGYFPHFVEDKPDTLLKKIAKAAGISVENQELPTDIAGLTHTFRPGKKWSGNLLQRTGETTDYDAIKGFDRYIESVSDVIHHTEDIQKLRDFENALRYKYSDEGTKQEIDEVKNMNLDESEKQAKLEELYKREPTHLPKFVTELRSYTDSLAGKKSINDRNVESDFNRGIYKTVSNLEGRIAANMVAINPGSWITNFIPLTQGYSELSTKSMVQAMQQTLSNMKNDDGFVDKSAFLTNRRGSDVLYKTATEKASEVLSRPMYYVDDFTSNVLTRAKTLDNINKGMDEQSAIKDADKWAASVIADRSKGALPTVFNRKNPLWKVFTMFQVEVNNQLSYLMKDMPSAQREKGLAQLSWALVKYLIGAYLYNEVYEKITGRRAALDPIGMVKDSFADFTKENVKNSTAFANLGENVAQQMPFIGGLLGGGRLPISSAMPDVTQLVKLGDEEIDPKKKKEIAIDEISKPLTYLALPFGGGQIKKAVEGIGTVAKGGSYTYNSKGEKQLQFPVFDKGIKEYAQGSTFGKYALPEAKTYIDSGFKKYSVKQTTAYDMLVGSGYDAKTSLENITEIGKIKGSEKQREHILNLPIKPKEKAKLDNLLVGELKNKIDYTSKDSFIISQESKTTQEKYKEIIEELSIDAAYTKMLHKAITGVKADKDSEGNSISGSAKEKKIEILMGKGMTKEEAEKIYDILY